jgi:two-component system sensor histidine kinase RegB
VKNAQDASSANGEVLLHASARGGPLLFQVVDHGPGIPADVLARVGEPFFTTKPPGSGMGLGFFVARTIIEQLGGRIALASVPGRGTTATITLPQSALQPLAAASSAHE